jgi:NADH dehydrogenase
MKFQELNIVTGAFSYTGKYITKRLISMGKKVKTLTGHPERRTSFSNQVSIAPFNFDKPNELVNSLKGAEVLYNTYWIRFPYGRITFDKAIENTKILINAAGKAGIQRIVHISITNASEESSLPYFRGKGIVENMIIRSGLPYAIIRPTVIFGIEDILINNIAWLLRKFPIFVVFGSGDYKLQPVFVEDVADIAVNAAYKDDNIIIDAVGPEIYTFNELVKLIADKINRRVKIIHLKPIWTLLFSKLIGYMVNDVILTEDEIKGLMENLLISENIPTGKTEISEWLDKNAHSIGKMYASELNRHYR